MPPPCIRPWVWILDRTLLGLDRRLWDSWPHAPFISCRTEYSGKFYLHLYLSSCMQLCTTVFIVLHAVMYKCIYLPACSYVQLYLSSCMQLCTSVFIFLHAVMSGLHACKLRPSQSESFYILFHFSLPFLSSFLHSHFFLLFFSTFPFFFSSLPFLSYYRHYLSFLIFFSTFPFYFLLQNV